MRIAHMLLIGVLGATPLAAQTAQPPAASVSTAVAASASSGEPAGGAVPVRLLVGRSTLIDVGVPITRVSLTSSDIADALVTSPNQLLVHGKVPGAISMFVWDRTGAIRRYEIAVQRDLARLSEQVTQLFPGEPIQVHSNGRQVVLAGVISSKETADKMVSVAAGYVERREDVVNLLQVQEAGTQQVLLRVRFAEVSRSALSELGASFFTSPTGVNNTLGRVTTQQFSAPTFDRLAWTKESPEFGAPVTSAGGEINFSDFLNLFLLSERYDLGLVIRAMQQKGLFQSLAEPNLVAESGKEASFLAGGEFPIPIAQGSGANMAISVQFKEFGIRLTFTPTVNGDRVHLKVRPEVSTLDYGNAIVLQGFRIPALITRRTETELELRNGQTFAIAGLLNNQMQSTMQKIPGIGDIPIIGYLFRSRAAQKEQTELVVMITPEILPPNSPGVTTELPRFQEPFMPPVPENRTQPPPPPAFVPQVSGLDGQLPALTAEQRDAVERALIDARERQASEERFRAAESRPAGRESSQAAPVVVQPSALTGGQRDAQDSAVEARERQALEDQARAPQGGLSGQRQAPVTEPQPSARELQREARRQREEQARLEKLAREQEKRDAAAAARERRDEERRLAAERKEQEKLEREQARRDAEAAKRQAVLDKQAAEEARRTAEQEQARQQAIADAEARLRQAEAQYQAELSRQAR